MKLRIITRYADPLSLVGSKTWKHYLDNEVKKSQNLEHKYAIHRRERDGFIALGIKDNRGRKKLQKQGEGENQ